MSERPTPETDSQIKTFTSISKLKRRFECSTGKVSAEFARRLERERDEAIRQRDETNESSVFSCNFYYEEKLKAERERDEAREKLAKITRAAEVVIDRWEQPAWKDTEPTATVIYRLRDALGREAE